MPYTCTITAVTTNEEGVIVFYTFTNEADPLMPKTEEIRFALSDSDTKIKKAGKDRRKVLDDLETDKNAIYKQVVTRVNELQTLVGLEV